MELTELEVSLRAADNVACLPPVPTVIAPAGGELGANAPESRQAESKMTRDSMVMQRAKENPAFGAAYIAPA